MKNCLYLCKRILKKLKMKTLYNYITCFLNNIHYDKLLVEHTVSRLMSDEWVFDWCTPEEFVSYLAYLWELNKKNFKDGFTFDDFFRVQIVLAYHNPEYFKIVMIGLGFIKKA